MKTPSGSHKIDIEAVLRPSRWASGMQVIGALPDYVATQLGLTTAARSVFLHQQTVAYICEQRTLTPRDAEFVFDYMPAPILRPMFCGAEERGDDRRVVLAEYIKKEGRYLYVVLTVARVRGGDELWVSGAHPMSEVTLRRHLRHGRLRSVVGRTIEGGKTRTARRVTPVVAATQMP